jgi:hypothetical protein
MCDAEKVKMRVTRIAIEDGRKIVYAEERWKRKAPPEPE